MGLNFVNWAEHIEKIQYIITQFATKIEAATDPNQPINFDEIVQAKLIDYPVDLVVIGLVLVIGRLK